MPTRVTSESGRATRDGERDRRVDADEVEHEVRAAALGELADLVRRGVAGEHPVRGADGLGERAARRADWSTATIRVGRHRGEDLDRHVAEATGTDHERGRAGHEPVERSLDRVVRREARVGQRRGVDRVQVGERDDVARARDEQERRHPAVEAEAAAFTLELGPVLAVVLHALQAPAAVSAAPGAVHRDGLRRSRAR